MLLSFKEDYSFAGYVDIWLFSQGNKPGQFGTAGDRGQDRQVSPGLWGLPRQAWNNTIYKCRFTVMKKQGGSLYISFFRV